MRPLKNAIFVQNEMGQKKMFGSGLTLRMTETGQYTKRVK
jgi:hypothetical protein